MSVSLPSSHKTRFKTFLLFFSPALPLIFLFGFNFLKQAWYSHHFVDKNLGEWSSDSYDVLPHIALKEMRKLIVANPDAVNFRVRWGFSNAGQNTDYYEVDYEYLKVKRTFTYKDSWGQKVETLLVYQNVSVDMILKVASQQQGSAHDFAFYNGVTEKRIVESQQ